MLDAVALGILRVAGRLQRLGAAREPGPGAGVPHAGLVDALAARYPDAPDHWIAMIAAKGPEAAAAMGAIVAGRGPSVAGVSSVPDGQDVSRRDGLPSRAGHPESLGAMPVPVGPKAQGKPDLGRGAGPSCGYSTDPDRLAIVRDTGSALLGSVADRFRPRAAGTRQVDGGFETSASGTSARDQGRSEDFIRPAASGTVDRRGDGAASGVKGERALALRRPVLAVGRVAWAADRPTGYKRVIGPAIRGIGVAVAGWVTARIVAAGGGAGVPEPRWSPPVAESADPSGSELGSRPGEAMPRQGRAAKPSLSVNDVGEPGEGSEAVNAARLHSTAGSDWRALLRPLAASLRSAPDAQGAAMPQTGPWPDLHRVGADRVGVAWEAVRPAFRREVADADAEILPHQVPFRQRQMPHPSFARPSTPPGWPALPQPGEDIPEAPIRSPAMARLAAEQEGAGWSA